MRKVLKATFIIIGSILFLLLAGLVFINTRPGQEFVRGRAEAYLRNKLHTGVWIGKLSYGLPKYIVFNNAVFLDQQRDTLLAVGTLKVDLDMMKLLRSKVDVQQVILKDASSHIYRVAPDTAFNFDYIITAFTPQNQKKKASKKNDAPISFHLDKFQLDNIHVIFDDFSGGVRFAMNLQHSDATIKDVDVNTMAYHITKLSVKGLQSTFRQDTAYLPPAPPKNPFKLKLAADNVDLQNIVFDYNNNLNKFLFALELGDAQLQLKEYNRAVNNRVDIGKLAINNSSAVLKLEASSTPPSPLDTIVKIDTTEGWFVTAKEIDFSGLNFKMDDENAPRLPAGIDYEHLDARNLKLDLENVYYNSVNYPKNVTGELKHLSVKEKSGLDIKELRTVFRYTNTGVTLRNLYAKTANSLIRDYLEVRFASVLALRNSLRSLQLKTNITNSYVTLYDAALFAPFLYKQPYYSKFKNSRIRLDARLDGFLHDLNVHKLYAQGLGSTEILVSGKLKGLPSPNISYDLNIAKFQTSRTDALAILPPSAVKGIRLPDKFGAVGKLAGNTTSFNAALAIASTDGFAHVKGSLSVVPGRERYNMVVQTRQLNLGRILIQEPMLGRVTGTFNVRGAGLDVKTMNADIDAKVAQAYVNGYNYTNVSSNVKVGGRNATVDLVSDDPNARLTLKGEVDFSNTYPAVIADADIGHVDLKALNLSATDFQASGTVHADIPELNPDYPRGNLVWHNPVIVTSGKRYAGDSLIVISKPSADSGQNIYVSLGFMEARLTGHIPLTKIGVIVQDRINRYYADLPSRDTFNTPRENIFATNWQGNKKRRKKNALLPSTNPEIPANYDLRLTARIDDNPLVKAFVPGLSSFQTVNVSGNLTPSEFNLDANTPLIIYDSISIANSKVRLVGNGDLAYDVTADKVSKGRLGLWYASITGKLERGLLTTSVSLSDQDKKERFALKGSMKAVNNTQVIQLEVLKLNYQVWDVSQPNSIVVTTAGFYVQNLEISHAGQIIRANSPTPAPNTPLNIGIENFQLASISQIVSISDTLPATGVLSGSVVIQTMKPSIKATGDIQVQNLAIYGDTVGNLVARVDNLGEDMLSTKLTLTGYGNDVDVSGVYYTKPRNGATIDFDVNARAIALRSLEGLSAGYVRNSSGFLRGNLKVKGSLAKPQLTGELRTDNVVTTIAMLGTEYRMPAERIVFDADQIRLDNFNLYDNAGNKAVANGTIGTKDLTNPQLDLSLQANNWRALHSTVKDNQYFYGDLYVTTNLVIKGTPKDPSADGNITVLKNTKMTVVNPNQKIQFQSAEGIVEFVKMFDSTGENYVVQKKVDSTMSTADALKLSTGTGVNVNITIDKEAAFTFIIDRASGDFIAVKGEGYFAVAVRPGGAIDVTGNYVINSGSYEMNYNFIKRKFVIQPNSTITFGGDPMKSTTLNVTAIYEANVPAYDLVARQVSDPSQLNYFKQRLPFSVSLFIRGNMMEPSISFDVALPDNKVYPMSPDNVDLVQAKLAQVRADTSELNRQVFAVLVLNRFISDDAFSQSVSQSFSSIAMQSVSTFIGEQLNQAAGQLIKGIDLSVDLATSDDYTTGEMRRRTDLNVAASKRLMNDRLKLTIGSNFELEGPQTNNYGNSSLVPGNIAADYMLTGDGRYQVRAYRRAYDAGVLQGYIQETGLNFVVSMDYNRFRQIFLGKKKRRNQRSDATASNDSSHVATGRRVY
jgi:hypothetical protein